MRNARMLVITLSLMFVMAACGGAEEPPPAPAEQPAADPPAAAETPAETPEATPEPALPPLLDPSSPEMNRQAPSVFRVAFDTTKGQFIVEAHRDWAPRGVDRFYNLVRNGFYDETRFFRVMDGFIAQFGIHADPQVTAAWMDADIPDDPDGVQNNTKGRLTFAHAGPNTRGTQLFVNTADNLQLDMRGFPPLGEVIEGMGVVESLYSGYGDGASAPNQGRINAEGNAYLAREFELLDYVRSARVIAER